MWLAVPGVKAGWRTTCVLISYWFYIDYYSNLCSLIHDDSLCNDDTHADTHKRTHICRNTHRPTKTQTRRQTHTHVPPHTHTPTHACTHVPTHEHTGRQTHSQTKIQTLRRLWLLLVPSSWRLSECPWSSSSLSHKQEVSQTFKCSCSRFSDKYVLESCVDSNMRRSLHILKCFYTHIYLYIYIYIYISIYIYLYIYLNLFFLNIHISTNKYILKHLY